MALQVRLHHQTVRKLKAMCGGSTPARIMKRAQILLSLHEGYSVDETAERVGCGTATVKRMRRRFHERGWQAAIVDAPRPGRPKKLTDTEERELIAIACTKPPDGASRWTIRLLVKHTGTKYSVVQRVLREDGIKPWREKNVVHSRD